ncbi:MAG: replicative DNA helicase [candidate division SR1 bacterium]|nr:MAG: replicative DNA helicase [candidate division SR1 bacterium]
MVSIEDVKLPPHNIDAEKGLLSGIFLDNEVMWVIEGAALHHNDFYVSENIAIFEAIQDLWAARKTIDVVTVSDQLDKNQKLDMVGGIDYLYDLAGYAFSTTSCPEYADIVKEKSILRQILKTTQGIVGDVYKQDDASEILSNIEKRIFDLTQFETGDTIRPIADILNSRVEEYMETVDNPEKQNEKKVFSGYSKLDDMLSGFKPGELIILAARPSMGKTSFALNILSNVAIEKDKSVAIFSLEMNSESIVDRIISEVSQVPMHKIVKGDLNNDDFERIGGAIENLGTKKIYIDDKGMATVPSVRSKLRRLKIEKGGLDLVIIDYLQLMHGTTYVGNRVQEISEISRGLKEMARELEVPVIALSQLSRAVEQRLDKKPQLSDLRESGAIEQDADSVLMLHREDYYDPETDKKGATDVCVRKNRNGAVGEVELHFEANIMKFVESKEELRSKRA